MMKSKVSVIMGTYNSEKTLSRAIDSILSQSFQDWIFIICDDGSTDNSLAILNQYKLDYPDKFLVLANKRNKGLAYSLNNCLKYADSEYIARMDADDISLPDRFLVQVGFLNEHPEVSFVGTAIDKFDETGVWTTTYFDNSIGKKQFLYSTGFVHPSVMIRKKALDDVNGYRDTWYTKRCEDYDLWMRLYESGFYGINLNSVLFQYYEGKDSFPKRKYRYRICEAITRAKGFALLDLYPLGLIFVLKPLIVGLLPNRLIRIFRKLLAKLGK